MSNGIKSAARLESQIRAVEGLCGAGVFWWEVIRRWDGAPGAWGGWTALIGGQQGYRNKEEMWGLKSRKGIGLNLSLLSPSFGSNRKFPSSNRKSSGAFSG